MTPNGQDFILITAIFWTFYFVQVRILRYTSILYVHWTAPQAVVSKCKGATEEINYWFCLLRKTSIKLHPSIKNHRIISFILCATVNCLFNFKTSTSYCNHRKIMSLLYEQSLCCHRRYYIWFCCFKPISILNICLCIPLYQICYLIIKYSTSLFYYSFIIDIFVEHYTHLLSLYFEQIISTSTLISHKIPKFYARSTSYVDNQARLAHKNSLNVRFKRGETIFSQ